MILLFRSCEANLSAGSLGDGTENKPRWNGKLKLEILRKCYLSIQPGIDKDDHIVIVNDRTSVETLQWMKNNTVAMFSVVDITALPDLRKNHPYPKYHPVVINACPDLMELVVDCAQRNPNEIIYVCEDDYLHVNHAISALKNVFSSGYKGFYTPYDYPDRYTIDSSRSCELYTSAFGHLRTIPSATLTIAALGETWIKYKYELLRAGVFADDSWTWKAFSQVGAVCPVPGHATHLQDGCISPFIDWLKVYDSI
jgi:hypothetical protein